MTPRTIAYFGRATRSCRRPISASAGCFLVAVAPMSAAVYVAVRARHQAHPSIAPTTADFRDVNLEGKSGVLATCGRDPRPRWMSSKRRLERPNGAMCVFFSGEELESLRGPQIKRSVRRNRSLGSWIGEAIIITLAVDNFVMVDDEDCGAGMLWDVHIGKDRKSIPPSRLAIDLSLPANG